MSRIDANIAISVADTYRPQAAGDDRLVHQQAARVRSMSADSEAGDPPQSQDVRAAAEHVRQVVEVASGRQLSFELDDSGKTLLFKFKGAQGETIKQIPSVDVLELHRRIDDLVGTLVDKTA